MVRWVPVIILSVFFLFGNYNFESLRSAIAYYGQSISQTYPTVGSIILILAIITIIFSEEMIYFIKKLNSEIKIKNNF